MKIELPIDAVMGEIIAQLHLHPNLVLQAPAGAGKTTRVPPALLDHGVIERGQIFLVEPRRIAARGAARRIACEMGERVGQTVGYKVRFESSFGPKTRIMAMTEGVLLRHLQDDPFLTGVEAIIFDEFHERRLDSDLSLAFTREIQRSVRPDLRLLVMSATFDPTPIANFLGGAPIVVSGGRTFPVRINYLSKKGETKIERLAAYGVERMIAEVEGDILVFLPGLAEIMRTKREISSLVDRHNIVLMTLYGEMEGESQDLVLQRNERRKIILATNVAETSLTIDGIEAVVDTGCAKSMRFDPAVGFNRLELLPISKAACDQRAGRAGRMGPGVCLRLWEERSHGFRADFELPEIHRVDLSAATLELRRWGVADLLKFPWYEPPEAEALELADRLLQLLGAIDGGGITPLGEEMAKLPLPPRISRLLLEGKRLGQAKRSALLAAFLSEREPFMRGTSSMSVKKGSRSDPLSSSDLLDRLIALEEFFRERKSETPFGRIREEAAKNIEKAANQLLRLLDEENDRASHGGEELLLAALVAAFPDRVTKRREKGSDRGVMVGGQGVRLDPQSSVQEAALFLSIDIDGRGSDARVRQASLVRREWLQPNFLRTHEELFFHPSYHRVVARQRISFLDLCLEESPTSISDKKEGSRLLFQAAKGRFIQLFPSDDPKIRSFLMRVRSLALWMKELQWPTFDLPLLEDILQELCEGKSSFEELRSAPWMEALRARLSPSLARLLEQEAPETIKLPSGGVGKILYEEGSPPILRARIQELFGWQGTPRIAGGRVPLLLHLLAPNMQPQQITTDLAGFWRTTYPIVRKELARRYPKHRWPENP